MLTGGVVLNVREHKRGRRLARNFEGLFPDHDLQKDFLLLGSVPHGSRPAFCQSGRLIGAARGGHSCTILNLGKKK